MVEMEVANSCPEVVKAGGGGVAVAVHFLLL